MRVFSIFTDQIYTDVSIGDQWLAATTWKSESEMGLIDVWSISTGELWDRCFQLKVSPTVVIDPLGRLIYVPDNWAIQILDLESNLGEVLPKTHLYAPLIAVSPNAETLAVTSIVGQRYGAVDIFCFQSDRGYKRLWGIELTSATHFEYPMVSPDGKKVAYCEGYHEGGVQEITRTGCFVHLIESSEQYSKIDILQYRSIINLCLPNQNYLFGLTQSSIRIWDTSTSKQLPPIDNPSTDNFTTCTIHPSSRWLVTGDTGGIIRYWDIETFTEVLALDWQQGPIESLAFSPDGLMGAAGTRTGRVVVWDVDL